MVTLLCTVRGCRLPLQREERRLVCESGHSFDFARSGYCNLLQPQDRRSRQPGDSREAVAARRRFLDRFGAPLLHDIAAMLTPTGPLLDAGCGEGYHTAEMKNHLGVETHGTDISVPAIEAAARRYRDCFFIVANADRFLPYADASFATVTSITSRMNPREFRRVLRDDGRLLVALPAADDVIELREAILGEAKLIDRTDRTVAAFAAHFSLERHQRARHVARLDRDAIHDVMASSYRGLRKSQRVALERTGDLDVTLSRDLLLFAPLTSSR